MVAVDINRGNRILAVDLRDLRLGCRAFEVAHKRDMEHYEKIQRALGISVVVLTAATGTAVITALATSTNMAAKIVVGTLSVLAAVAAALNEKGPFADQLKAHLDKAAGFNKIHRRLVDLHRDWGRDDIGSDDVDRKLKALEASYDELENSEPGVRHYVAAREWVEAHEPPDELLASRP